MAYILILYYSKHGATKALAEHIARGIELQGLETKLRTVPPIRNTEEEPLLSSLPETGAPYVTSDELANCAGLALGSPTRFGNMAAPLKHFLDSTTLHWLKGKLIDKPACVFTSSSSLHGGQESTLLTMTIPLLHQGMIICGLPYSEPDLHTTHTGGSPYGVTHYAVQDSPVLSDEEKRLCLAQGSRLAILANKLL